MRTPTLRFVLLLLALASAAALAQVGHPAKGSWLGYWGPGEDGRNRMLLLLDWENREVVGTINPGPKAVPVKRAEIDYDTWTMTVEADLPAANGRVTPWIATGRLENLGSWINRRYSGTYQHGAERGTFSLTLN